MKVLSTICPVFFMIGLGLFCRKRQIVTTEQAEGLNRVVCTALFPIMVFNALFTTKLQISMLAVILYLFAVHLAAMGIGFATAKFTGEKFAAVSPFLMATIDGGNVCYPLYATLVGAQYVGNVVLLDIACMLVVFLVIPVLVSTKTAKSSDGKALLLNIVKNPLVITIFLALLLQSLGLYGVLERTDFITVYNSIISMATAPIVGSILFMIGYRFRIERSSLLPLIKCILCRVILMSCAAALFFVLFPDLTADPVFAVLVPLYFLTTPALVLTVQLEPLFRSKEDAGFCSAYISLYMIVTLAVYLALAMATV